MHFCQFSVVFKTWYTLCFCCQTLSLFNRAEQKHRENFGWSIKEQLLLLWQTGPQWANALKIVWPTLEGVVRSFIVFKEQGMITSWTILGLVASRWSFKHYQFSSFNQSRMYILVVSSILQMEGVVLLPAQSFSPVWFLDAMDCSAPGCSVHWIPRQERIQECFAIPSVEGLPSAGIEPGFPASPALEGRFFFTRKTPRKHWGVGSHPPVITT